MQSSGMSCRENARLCLLRCHAREGGHPVFQRRSSRTPASGILDRPVPSTQSFDEATRSRRAGALAKAASRAMTSERGSFEKRAKQRSPSSQTGEFLGMRRDSPWERAGILSIALYLVAFLWV